MKYFLPFTKSKTYQFFFSSDFFNQSKLRGVTLLAIFGVWIVIVLITTMHHEYWRDEIRAVSVALGSPDFLSIPFFIKNEGHPALWYFILRGANYFLSPSLTLPLISISICGAAILIFLFYSPFSLAFKIIYTFSILPLYEYSVMVRNYGISMLLMYLFAVLYANRVKNIFLLTLILVLLANTNLPGLIVAAILSSLLFFNFLNDRKKYSREFFVRLVFCALLIFFGGIFSFYTLLPDESSLLTGATNLRPFAEYGNSLKHSLYYPGRVISEALSVSPSYAMSLVAQFLSWLLMLGLLKRFSFFLAIFSAFIIFGFINHFAYFISLRHQGILITLILVLYWIDALSPPNKVAYAINFLYKVCIFFALPALFIFGDYAAIERVNYDLKYDVSSSKSMGNWIHKHSEWNNAIIIGEPDYILEALPIYANLQIYIPRESIFRQYGKSTNKQQQKIHIEELLAIAQKLKWEQSRPILIAFAWPPQDFENQKLKKFPYNRELIWSEDEWLRFKNATDYLGAFNKSKSDENYYLYGLK